MIGFAMWPHIWRLMVLTSCFYALYCERIMLAEEAYLREKFGETFERWSAQTLAFIPKFRGWMPSPVSFCWRTVAQREYNAFFLIITVFFLLDLIGDSIAERRFQVDTGWFATFIVGFFIFAILAHLEKANSSVKRPRTLRGLTPETV
jgi:hypothetical protein